MRSLYQDLTESAAISTTPQRERSDAHKVPRGLREHILDFHKAWRAPRIMNIENVKNDVLPWSQQLFCPGLQSIVPAMKNEPEASEVLHLPHGIIIMSQIQKYLPRKMTSETTSPKKCPVSCARRAKKTSRPKMYRRDNAATRHGRSSNHFLRVIPTS